MKYLFFVIVVILIIYFPWFNLNNTLSSGDWPYLYPENIESFSFQTRTPFLWLDPYYQLTAKLGVQFLSLSWELVEKIFWFWPFLTISVASSYLFLKYLAKELGINNNPIIFTSFGSLIFTTNTYILMLTGGGQMGVSMAYSMTPLVLFYLMKLINLSNTTNPNFKFLIVTWLVLAVQLMFDPRIFLLSILIIFLYILFNLENFNTKIFKRIILVLILTITANLFWILPNFVYFNTEYKSAIDAANASYLSFATFSNSISLLHPNWPENIFGKIGFMKSEFIILPILAFLPLLLKPNRAVLFFSFLGLFGAFFAKGTNPPFGELYEWLSNFPGFSIFRDPTKFYVLIVVSYIVLIPLSLHKLSDKVSSIKFRIFIIAFLVFWMILIHPALLGHLTGTFEPHEVPKEYIVFKDFLNVQPENTKTLWVPSIERFGFNSRNMPAISSMELFGASSIFGVLDKFDKPEIKEQLIDEEVKYIIVPDDYMMEIFITDRKYDDKLYIDTVNKLRSTVWLYEVKSFGKIKVFEMK